MDIYVNLYIVWMLFLTAFVSLAIAWVDVAWKRYSLCLLFTFILGCGLFFPPGLFGLPKPVKMEWRHRHIEDAAVLASVIVEGEGIYALLAWDELPRYYVYSWNEELADQLARAQQEAREQRTELHIRYPFRGTPSARAQAGRGGMQDASSSETSGADLDEEPMFYARPQQRLPDKPQVQLHDFSGTAIPLGSLPALPNPEVPQIPDP